MWPGQLLAIRKLLQRETGSWQPLRYSIAGVWRGSPDLISELSQYAGGHKRFL